MNHQLHGLRPLLHSIVLVLTLGGLAACGSSTIDLVERPGREVLAENAGPAINSQADDFAPVLSADGTRLMFTSNRLLEKDGDRIENVYEAPREGGAWTAAQRIDASGDPDIKSGSLAFDNVHNEVVFVQCYRNDGMGDCDLYIASTGRDGWRTARNPGDPVNSPEWDCHPSISRDGSTLYFASERIGGMGGSDIYLSRRGTDGTWSRPVNLGPPVNTRGDEKTPFIAPDNTTLYFASNGHPGYGAFDIFQTTFDGDRWTAPKNVGTPINSPRQDLFYTPSLTGDTAYLASNRDDATGFDIYEIIIRRKVEPPTPQRTTLVVRLIVRNAFTNEPISATIAIEAPDAEPLSLTADVKGIADVEMQPGAAYTITTTHPGFMPSTTGITLPRTASGRREQEILMTPHGEKESTIYSFVVEFDFNLSNIRESERRNLDSVVTLLTRYPECSVMVSGHTDSVGTDEYNQRLGQERAQEVGAYVERYLKSRGVQLRNPLVMRSFGETQHVASNATEEGRQRNRRVVISLQRLQ